MTSSNRFKSLKFWLKHAIWFVPTAYVLNFIYAITSDQTGGTFGDTFGAANALFSGTALLMLVLAVTLQREELEQVKEERNDTKELLKSQEELTELQKVALEKQIFEQTFSSFLTAALNEKARLNQKPVVNNKETTSDYFNAALFSVRLLAKFTTEEDPFSAKHTGIRKVASKNFVLANMLLHLDQLVSSSCPVDDDVPRLLELLGSLVDEETGACIAWYTCVEKKENGDCGKFAEFVDRYQVKSHMPPSSVEGYEIFLHDQHTH